MFSTEKSFVQYVSLDDMKIALIWEIGKKKTYIYIYD